MVVAVGLALAWLWSAMPVYWIEDAYIHLATARNLVEHGVYGATPHEFTSSSSSPLWVALLAICMALVGSTVQMALALNIVLALAFAAVVARVLAGTDGWFAGIAAALAVLMVAPVPLVLSGMEHLGHAAAMVLAVWWLSRRLSDDGAPVNDVPLLLLLLALPLLRYESLWLHVLGTALALVRGERRFALLVAAVGALPVLAFGLYSQSQGWPFLPAPILAKTVYLADPATNGAVWLAKYLLWWPLKRLVTYVPELLAMMIAADCWLAWTLWRDRRSWRHAHWIAVLFFLLGSWAHATFAAFGWGGRYEAYLLAVGLVALGMALPRTDWRAVAEKKSRERLVGALAAVFLCLAVLRGWTQHADLPGRAETVALRDVWPAQLVRDACGPQPPCPLKVMTMNIGALSWYAGPRLTDLLALADREALALLGERRLDGAAVRRLADIRQIDVALIFDDFYAEWIGGRPPLIKVATLVQQTDWPTPLSVYVRDAADAPLMVGFLRHTPRPARLRIEFEPAFR